MTSYQPFPHWMVANVNKDVVRIIPHTIIYDNTFAPTIVLQFTFYDDLIAILNILFHK